ncbi:hypothetical protein MBLNU230_g8090t1 [Neophaeotheca triangularis]
MRSFTATVFLAMSGLAHCHDIVLTNDNGFADYTIRKMYDALREAEHNVVLSAPPYDMSVEKYEKKWGEKAVIDARPFEGDKTCDFHACDQDAPPIGTDEKDDRINYFHGPPTSALFYGLNTLSKDFKFHGAHPLAVIGPDQGSLNIGRGPTKEYGVIGAAKMAAQLGYPAIAISANQGAVRAWDTNSPPAEAETQVEIAKMVIDAVLAESQPFGHPNGEKVYPSLIEPGSFLSVNIGGNRKKPCELDDYKWAWTALQKYDHYDDPTAMTGHPKGGPICNGRDKDKKKTNLMPDNDYWDKGDDKKKCHVSISIGRWDDDKPHHKEVLDTFNLMQRNLPGVEITPYCGKYIGHASPGDLIAGQHDPEERKEEWTLF